MTLEIITTTMHKSNIEKYTEMNLQTDAVIANQGENSCYEEHELNGKKIKFVSTQTRGVGNNRNIGYIHSSADLILFADDDMVFVDEYENIIKDAFSKTPQADGIVFGVKNGMQFSSNKRAKFKNVTSGGIWGLVIKREFLLQNNIWASPLFGGGARYSCGEDSLFFKDLFKNKARIFLSTQNIATNNEGESTWFEGFTDKYFVDRGIIYAKLTPMLAHLACLYHLFKHKNVRYKDIDIKKAIRLSFLGVKIARNPRKGVKLYEDFICQL